MKSVDLKYFLSGFGCFIIWRFNCL